MIHYAEYIWKEVHLLPKSEISLEVLIFEFDRFRSFHFSSEFSHTQTSLFRNSFSASFNDAGIDKNPRFSRLISSSPLFKSTTTICLRTATCTAAKPIPFLHTWSRACSRRAQIIFRQIHLPGELSASAPDQERYERLAMPS